MEEEILAKKELIHNLLEKHLRAYSSRKKQNRSRSKLQHLSVTLIGAVITIFSGINIECATTDSFCFNDYSRFIVLILGAIVTVIGAYKTFFNNNNLWIKYTVASNELKKIQSEYEYYLAGKKDANIEISELDQFKDSIQEVIDKLNKDWTSLRITSST